MSDSVSRAPIAPKHVGDCERDLHASECPCQQSASRPVRAPMLPDECPDCGEWIEYVPDPDGLWAECACAAGYVS